MFAIPLPFVVALLQLLLLYGLIGRSETRSPGGAVPVFIAVSVLTSVIIGLRWSVNWSVLRLIQPVVASMLPPLAWLSFSGAGLRWQRAWRHALPVVLTGVLVLVWRAALDLEMPALFFAYGIALLRLAQGGTDAMVSVRLADTATALRAVVLAGMLLMVSGVIDLLISADFNLAHGQHVGLVLTLTNLLMLLISTGLVTRLMRLRPPPEPPVDASRGDVPALPDPADHQILAAIDRQMQGIALYRDPDLTLERLARRLVIPARRISAAINRVHGRNVSQFINSYRIAEAKRLLRNSAQSITDIQFSVGFQTKSNFNREFRRQTALSPSEYRNAFAASGTDGAETR